MRKIFKIIIVLVFIGITGIIFLLYDAFSNPRIKGWIYSPSLLGLNDTVFFLRNENRTLFSSKLDGSEEKELQKDIYGYKISPDGKKIVTQPSCRDWETNKRKVCEVIIVDLITGKKEVVDSYAGNLSDFFPMPEWSPDSNKIAYARPYEKKIIIYDFLEKTKEEIMNVDFSDLKWTNDGNSLIFYAAGCALASEKQKDCYTVYDVVDKQYNKKDYQIKYWYDFMDFYKIHFNQTDSFLFVSDYGRGYSPNKKYVLHEKNCDLYISTLSDTDINEIEKDEVLVNFSKCSWGFDSGSYPSFRYIGWYPNSKFAFFSFLPDETMYIVDITTKKVYKTAIKSQSGLSVYLPNFIPAMPIIDLSL